MDGMTYRCETEGCELQGQPVEIRWCTACGLPNEAAPGAQVAQGGRSRPVTAPSPGGGSLTSLARRNSGALAIAVVVALAGTAWFVGHHAWASRETAGSQTGAVGPQYQAPDAGLAASEATTETSSSTDTTEETAAETTTTSVAPTITGPPRELAGDARASSSSTAPDNVDDAGNRTNYDVANVLDGDPSTAWRAEGDGSGVTVTIDLPVSAHLVAVGLVPGYAKKDPSSGKDRFIQERRIREVRWHFDDGTVVEQRFQDRHSMQRTSVDVLTSSVTIEIVATLPGDPDFDYTPISEVSLQGTM